MADWDTLPSGKLQRGTCSRSGQQVLRSPVSPTDVTLVSALVNKLVTVIGGLCGTSVQMMMDSGSSASLITQEIAIKNWVSFRENEPSLYGTVSAKIAPRIYYKML